MCDTQGDPAKRVAKYKRNEEILIKWMIAIAEKTYDRNDSPRQKTPGKLYDGFIEAIGRNPWLIRPNMVPGQVPVAAHEALNGRKDHDNYMESMQKARPYHLRSDETALRSCRRHKHHTSRLNKVVKALNRITAGGMTPAPKRRGSIATKKRMMPKQPFSYLSRKVSCP